MSSAPDAFLNEIIGKLRQISHADGSKGCCYLNRLDVSGGAYGRRLWCRGGDARARAVTVADDEISRGLYANFVRRYPKSYLEGVEVSAGRFPRRS